MLWVLYSNTDYFAKLSLQLSLLVLTLHDFLDLFFALTYSTMAAAKGQTLQYERKSVAAYAMQLKDKLFSTTVVVVAQH